jgi:hypothetical protein
MTRASQEAGFPAGYIRPLEEIKTSGQAPRPPAVAGQRAGARQGSAAGCPRVGGPRRLAAAEDTRAGARQGRGAGPAG